jgi:hypothetical protein
MSIPDEIISKMQDVDILCFRGTCPTCGSSWQGWVPCSVEMPKVGQRVYVWPQELTAGYFGNGRWAFDAPGNFDPPQAWQPLPRRPK